MTCDLCAIISAQTSLKKKKQSCLFSSATCKGRPKKAKQHFRERVGCKISGKWQRVVLQPKRIAGWTWDIVNQMITSHLLTSLMKKWFIHWRIIYCMPSWDICTYSVLIVTVLFYRKWFILSVTFQVNTGTLVSICIPPWIYVKFSDFLSEPWQTHGKFLISWNSTIFV